MRVGLLTNIGLTLDLFFPPLVEQWEKLGWQVFPAAGSLSTSFENKVFRGMTRRPSPVNLMAPRELAEWAREDRLDVIITNNATTSTLARVRKLPVPVVYFCHGLHWNTGQPPAERLWQTIEGALIRNTAAVLTMNSNDYAWFSERMPSDRIHFLKGGVGVPLDQYPRADIPARPPLKLVWAGEFSERKRPGLMLDIAERLHQRGVDFRLTMLGDGGLYDDMRERLAASPASGVVEMPGRRPLPSWVADSHLMVLTSEWEGLPRVLLEGYAMGRRSLAFDVKGTRDIPGVALVPDEDVPAFADRLAQVAGSGDMIGHDDDVAWLDTSNVALEIRDFVDGVIRVADS